MDIILLKDVDSLGNAGEIVKVKPGYARNYLFAKGLAVRSSKKNRALVWIVITKIGVIARMQQ